MALSQLVEVQGLANNERGSGGGNIAMFALQAGLKQVRAPLELDGHSYCRKPISLSACIGREQLLCPTVLLLAVAAIAASRGSSRIPKKAAADRLPCVPGTCGRCCWVWVWVWGWVGQDTALLQAHGTGAALPNISSLLGDQQGIPFFFFPPSFSLN